MAVGFTGTRNGMTDAQKTTVWRLLDELRDRHDVAHHGDCDGADEEFHVLACGLGFRTEAHPGHDRYGKSPTRAYCKADVIHDSLPYLRRDRIIADKDVLIGTPKNFKPIPRGSGTWTTIGYGRRNATTRVLIVYPDGAVEEAA